MFASMSVVKDEFLICDGLFILTKCVDEENKRQMLNCFQFAWSNMDRVEFSK